MRWIIALFGAVCALIGLGHVLLGPRIIPGSLPVNATMDSEGRFYAALFIGFGLACIWTSRALSRRGRVLAALMLVFLAGGLARLISWGAVGAPHGLFRLLTLVELALPVLVLAWLQARGYLRPCPGAA